MAWYYMDGDQEIGPVEKEDLQDLVKAKRIGRQTLVRNSTMNEWKPLAEFARKKQKTEDVQPPEETITGTEAGAQPPDAPPSGAEADAESPEDAPAPHADTVLCSQCGRSFSRDEVVSFGHEMICADCKPMFVQQIKEGAAPTEGLRYAGFWIRFGAKLIDGILLFAVIFVISIPLNLIFLSYMPANTEDVAFSAAWVFNVLARQFVSIAISGCYSTYLIGRFGATVGKMACGLVVVTPSGGRVSYPRALGRYFAEWVSQLILYIGYIMVAFDSEKRALHDHMCSTRVIYKK